MFLRFTCPALAHVGRCVMYFLSTLCVFSCVVKAKQTETKYYIFVQNVSHNPSLVIMFFNIYFRSLIQQIISGMSFGNTRHFVFILVLLGTVFVCIIISNVFQFTQPAPHLKETGRQTEKRISAYVLILAQPRTGSSFLGQLFNQHPGVFYLYEPLLPFSMFQTLNYVTEKGHATLVASFLRNLSRCSLNAFQDYFSFISHSGLSSPHFRLSSRSLSFPPLCKSEATTFDSQSEILKKCPLLNAKGVSLVCAKKEFVATKILTPRLPEMVLKELFEQFHSQAETPIKIIQLVRDPRAMVWSMIKMGLIERGIKNNARTDYYNKKQNSTSQPLKRRNSTTLGHNFIKQVKLLCNRITKDVNISLHLLSKRGADPHITVRYEELARSTLAFARKIFAFTGIDFAPEVKEWLRRNRLFDKNGSSDSERSYSTSNRNTTVTINVWREGLTFLETSLIDKECAYFMQKFGYKFIDNIDVLTNISISLLQPLGTVFTPCKN